MHGHLQKLDENDVRNAYKRWTPVYDAVFGKVVVAGVKQAAARASAFFGGLWEVAWATAWHFGTMAHGD